MKKFRTEFVFEQYAKSKDDLIDQFIDSGIDVYEYLGTNVVEVNQTVKAYCPDCEKEQDTKIMIPCCDKNPEGLKNPIEHGNIIDGTTTCDDDYCNPSEFEFDPEIDKRMLEDFEEYYFRCSVCDSLNIDCYAREVIAKARS